MTKVKWVLAVASVVFAATCTALMWSAAGDPDLPFSAGVCFGVVTVGLWMLAATAVREALR